MRRKRNRLNWAPIVWLALLGNCVYALGNSPLLTPNRVRVIGAKQDDHERVEKIVQLLAGKPALNPPMREVFEQLARRPDVRKIDLKLNPFGAGQLRLSYEPAVAKVLGQEGLTMGRDGTLLPLREASTLPVSVKLPTVAYEPVLSVAGAYEGRKIAEVCQEARGLGSLEVTVSAADDGSVSLAFAGKTKVELGLPDRLAQKFDRLQQVLSANPDLLQDDSVVNLMSPDQPVLRKGSSSSEKPNTP